MSKELEALDIQGNFINAFKELLSKTDHNVLLVNVTRNMAQELVNLYEQYKNANPSEALECLNKIVESFNETTTGMYGLGEVVVANDLIYGFKKELNTIKQALIQMEKCLGARRNEKALEQNRDKWAINDCYVFPGAVQYFGPSCVCDVTTITLQLEQEKALVNV